MKTAQNAPLDGRRIAVPESRELDLFGEILERQGAVVVRCPMVSIVDAPDPQAVLAWIAAFNDGACDDLILYTGEGLKRLLSCIERYRPDQRAAFLARLARVRKITRGPKPDRVLRALGLKSDLSAEPATTAGLIALLRRHPLAHRTVGMQRYGQQANPALETFLEQAGARVLPVAPYAYADASDASAVLALIDELAAGRIDAIAFTSAAQVQRLLQVAQANGVVAEVQRGLRRCVVAAVGPVVADALGRYGVEVDAAPEARYFLKPLTRALIEALSQHHVKPPGEAP